MGSDKSSEPSEPTGFHIGNNLWVAELPVLQTLLHDGDIDDIILNVLDYQGINFIRTLSLKHDVIDLPVWRRNWHTFDDPSTKKSFVDGIVKQEDWDKWRSEPPRK